LFAIAAFGVGLLALARCVGLLHRALWMNPGGRVRLLAANWAAATGRSLIEQRLGFSIIVNAHRGCGLVKKMSEACGQSPREKTAAAIARNVRINCY
jgi:hypothetical protein